MALTPLTPPPRSLQSKPRRVHLVLRDGAEVEGGIFLNDGQALAPYLGTRKGGWVNLVAAQWILPVEESVNHAVLQADHILYAYGVEGDVPVHGTTGQVAVRHVEVTLTTDARIRGQLFIADRQRLSDFLHTVGKFIPIVAVHRTDTDQLVGDIALNHAAVRVLRDTASTGRKTTALDGRASMMTPAIGAAFVEHDDARMTPPLGVHTQDARNAPPPRRATAAIGLGGVPLDPTRRDTPRATPVDSAAIAAAAAAATEAGVRSETIAVPGGGYTLEVPGPSVERRSGSNRAVRARVTLNLDGDNPVEVTQETEDEAPPAVVYSPAVQARADRLNRHWLSLVGQRFGLNPADPRPLEEKFTTEQVWDAIARANEITADEFAVHVASTFRVPVARLDRIEAKAVHMLDEKVARKFGMIPVRADEKSMTVACSDPTDLEMEQALRFATRHSISFELAPPRAIRGALDWWYRGELRPSTTVGVVK
jgi:hypothetical protein